MELESPLKDLPSQLLSSSSQAGKRHFDERLISNLSIQQRSPTKSDRDRDVDFISESETVSIKSISTWEPLYTSASLEWLKLTKLSNQIYSTTSIHENGDPQSMLVSDEYIAIATTKCNILLFSYKQILLLKIKSTNILPSTRITALALSVDSTYLLVGYSNGHINLWDLKRTDPIISIRPVTAHELQYDGTHYHIAHFEGTPIRKLSFIASRHTAFISSDDNGMMISHNGGKALIGYYCRSKIIVGKYNLTNIINRKIDYSNTILDLHLLPVGSIKLNTDYMNLIAVITPHALIVLSLSPTPTTQIKLGKPRILDENLGVSGCVSWFPAMESSDIKSENLPMLAYCWSNVLSVFELSNKIVIYENGEKNPTLEMVNKRRTKCIESIVSLHWLTPRVLLALTRSQKLLFFDSQTLNILKEEDLITKQIKYQTLFQSNQFGLIEKNYSGSFNTLKSNILLFQNKEIVIGNLSNWADVLLDLLNNGKYVEALEESKRQYEGSEDIPLLSLPDNNDSRHDMMKDYLIRIFKSSLKYIFTQKSTSENNTQDFRRITLLAIQTCSTISAPTEMYDILYEKLADYNLENLFFDELENFIFSSEIVTFSPTILKAMVSYYIAENLPNTLEQLICLLDIEQLDIDLTVSLCRKYHLNETLTYIYTTLLHDYFTPLIEAVLKIKEFYSNSNILSESENGQLLKDISYIYPYISYTLTGRQYPTDKLLPYTYNTSAKLNIYYFLFNGSSISWPLGSPKIHIVDNYKYEPAFPYLCLLLKYDSENMFSCLNEVFEDELLNSNEMAVSGVTTENKNQMRVNRQYIVDVLLGIFQDPDADFNMIDKIRLSVFITRNYPKYIQFIRIADSIADEMIVLICKAGTMRADEDLAPELIQDCELGLQSLLSVYKPVDMDYVILNVEKAGYYQVLLNLYQSENRYIDVLKLWVRLHKFDGKEKEADILENTAYFKPITEIIRQVLKNADNSEKRDIVKLLTDDFEIYVNSDPKGIAQIVSNLCPQLNSRVVNFHEGPIKFEYLKEIFSISEKGKVKVNGEYIDKNLRLEYLKSLIKQKKLVEFSIAKNNKEYSHEYAEELIDKRNNLEKKIREFILTMDSLDGDILALLESQERNEFDLVVNWYVFKGDYPNAIQVICKILETVSEDMQRSGYTKEKESLIWKALNLSFSTLTTTDGRLNVIMKTDSLLTLREQLLLQIVELSVKLLVNVTKKTSSTDSNADETTIDVFKKLVQSTFTYMVNTSGDNSNSFSNIFEQFLAGKSVHMTTLGDIRIIMKELFLSYSNDQQILSLIQTLVDEDIFDDLTILESMKVKGWSPKNIECETCGKKIWGSRIGNGVYESWWDHKLSGLKEQHDEISDNKEIGDGDRINELYLFQCRHTYHRKCLDNMGMINDGSKKCIICDEKKNNNSD